MYFSIQNVTAECTHWCVAEPLLSVTNRMTSAANSYIYIRAIRSMNATKSMTTTTAQTTADNFGYITIKIYLLAREQSVHAEWMKFAAAATVADVCV